MKMSLPSRYLLSPVIFTGIISGLCAGLIAFSANASDTASNKSDKSVFFNASPHIDTDINVQGFGGLINVPTANSIGYGELHWTFSNLTDNGAYSNGTSNGLYQDGNNLSTYREPISWIRSYLT